MKTTVIVTTYNWPEALDKVLQSLSAQTVIPDEVIIADDGSSSSVIEKINKTVESIDNLKIRHVWHEDQGFRAAEIRNRAVGESSGEYLIFIDGDSIPCRRFVELHNKNRRKGWFVSGGRILMSKVYTEKLLKGELEENPCSVRSHVWFMRYLSSHVNKPLRRIIVPQLIARWWWKRRWEGARTCNLAIWKRDFESVNGFDLEFSGWGYEDSDLVVRLLRKGLSRCHLGIGNPVLHCWHPEEPRTRRETNYRMLTESIEGNRPVRATCGMKLS